MNLTSRQTQILKALVEEYVSTAEPVASEELEKRYTLGVSPATIRNEMAHLTEQGFLKQPHTSAGRIPTPMGLKFYIDNLMQEKKLSVSDEVTSKERIWDARHDREKLLRQASLALADRTKNLSIIATEDGDIYYAGIAHMLDLPEFFDIDVTKTVLSLLDEERRLHNLFFERVYTEHPIHVIFGADLGWPFFDPVGVAFTHFELGGGQKGTAAVVGPYRLNFPYVYPTLRYFSSMITDLTRAW